LTSLPVFQVMVSQAILVVRYVLVVPFLATESDYEPQNV
jgi:hypothetical protein